MGLAVSPRLRFLKKAAAAAAPAPIEEEAGEDVDDDEPTKPAAAAKDTEAEGTDWHMDEEVEDGSCPPPPSLSRATIFIVLVH